MEIKTLPCYTTAVQEAAEEGHRGRTAFSSWNKIMVAEEVRGPCVKQSKI